MPPPHLSQFSPLHTGRSFICYRDVNRAIEKHREIYGLRLVLKKAVKLENYCLTVDQMRDLNFRLKYGQLDYQCSVDNGRPGRPGNDERCPRLVRLRLSPDARTLVVYDTHVHDTPARTSPGMPQSLSPPCPVPEPVTVLSPPGLVPLSQVQETPSPASTAFTSPPLQGTSQLPITSADSSRTPEGFYTPVATASTPTATSIPSHEKITVKLKKSQFSPNEMVVVGSARDAQEQLELRNSPEKASVTPSPHVALDKNGSKVMPKQQLSHKYPEGAYTVSKVVRRPPIKPATGVEKIGSSQPERVGAKQSERTPTRPQERNFSRPPVTKGEKVTRAPLRPSAPQRANDKVAARLGGGSYSNGNSHSNGVRSVTSTSGKRLQKKKKARHSEPTFDLSMLAPLDTELGVSEKQQLAHGVLLRLLRVTSQLPMIQFSHALDTLETLTDAYKLEQRVNLTINHEQEEEHDNLYTQDPYELVDLEEEEKSGASQYYQSDTSVTSTTSDTRTALTQVDGASDQPEDGQKKRPGPGASWSDGEGECHTLTAQLSQGWKVARTSL